MSFDSVKVFYQRAKVVAGSAVTWLSGLAVAVTAFSAQIASVAPDGWADTTARWGLVAAGWLTAAVAVIRRVAPVPEPQRGVLPKNHFDWP